MHQCPLVDGKTRHKGGPTATGSSNVFINGQPAARVGDMAVCNGPPDTIVQGSSTVFINGMPAATMGSVTAHGGIVIGGSGDVFIGDVTPVEPSPAAEASFIDTLVGGAKELLNQFLRENAAIHAEWMAGSGIIQYQDQATGEILSAEEVAYRYKTEGRDMIPLSNETEQAAAKSLRNLPQTPAVVSAITALGSRGKSLLRKPDQIILDIEQALLNSRSSSEALGKVGMEQAKKRQGITTDPRYIDRYHGPDDLALDKSGKLVEIEAKGNNRDSLAVAKNTNLERQSSEKKNKRRAKLMTKQKHKKVNQPSNRQGGPYVNSEIELWSEIIRSKGQKRHLSTHTNTETGRVRILERDSRGNVTDTLDDFNIESFDKVKQLVMEAFK
ncbi:PAAR domain-containing protein [Alkalimarinus coralli]|uniref:PAAR domain-containing protein n=1 Tax=Alkalimarinus coralli TaxID=2935863 RepID=UPI00202B53C8|nr:PAAR domain-containing protein [Alkalimarinus coralli]